jgi:pilus assembly protein CpaE
MPKMITIQLEVRNQKVRKDLEKVISQMNGFHLLNSKTLGSCDLLILEIGDDLKWDFQLLRSVQSSEFVGSVFLTSDRLEPNVLIEALRAGAKEFFPQPIQEEEVRNALIKYKERKIKNEPGGEQPKKGKIIHTIGSKGGIGVTTIAVNLATNLAALNKSVSVALIDMNLTFGEIPIFLNIKSAFDWRELIQNISRVDATLLQNILSKHSSGVFVLPSPTGSNGLNQPTRKIIEKILEVMQETFHFTVIDGGQSIDERSLKFLEMADEVLLATSLSLPCLTNTKSLLQTFQKLGFPRKENIKIIINRYQKNSLISPKETEASIGHKIFWRIPNDFHTTMSAINQGKTISQIGHSTEISKNLRELAGSFLEKGLDEKEKSRFWSKMIK